MNNPCPRLTRLLEPIHSDARGFARRLCRSDAEGDDVFHDAVLRALDKIGDLRDDGAFRAWFYRIVISVQRNRYRRSLWARLVPLGDRDHELATGSFADDLAGAQRARLALSRLPAPQREALVLFELEGMTVDEIAALQGASSSAIKSRLTRARARLRSIYIKKLGITQVPQRNPA